MGTEIPVLLFVILGVMIVLFISNRVPVDLTAVAGLVVLVYCGYLRADQAFIGFSSSAVITMMSTFFLGAALRITGVGAFVAGYIHRYVGSSEVLCVIAVMFLAAFFSSFMNNVAAVAVLFPAAVSLAHKSEIPPSRLLLPLAYGAVLGGTTTMIGTPPNIIIAEIIESRGVGGYPGFFEFFPVGFALVVAGVAFVSVIGRPILPRLMSRRRRRRDLARVYKLHERLLSLKVPQQSELIGKTLEEIRLGQVLDAQVIAIGRDGEQKLAPNPKEHLLAGDTLIVRGKPSSLKSLRRFQNIHVERFQKERAADVTSQMNAAGFQLIDKGLRGWTLRDLKFRKRFGVMVAAIQREERYIHRRLAGEALSEGDVVHVVGTDRQIQQLSNDPYFARIESDVQVQEFLENHLFLAEVAEESSLAGVTLQDSKLGEQAGMTILGVMSEGELLFPAPRDRELIPGDKLLVSGEADDVLTLSQLAELEIESTDVAPSLESSEIGMVEVVLSPRSKLLDQSLKDIKFREKYGFQVIAIWREGRPVRSRVGVDALRFGDALLLQGPRKKIPLLIEDPDFVVLSDTEESSAPRKKKAVFAVAGIVLMIVLATSGLQPVHMAAFTAAVFVAVCGAVTMEEAYQEIEWRVVFLVACMIPVGIAVKDSGAAVLLSNAIVDSVGPFGPHAVLIALSVVSSLLSQTLDGSLSVILLAPVGLEAAATMGVNPYPFLVGIALSASVAFLTPFSHRAGLLVMGAGGYQVKDYLKVGTPLSIVSFVVLWILVPLIYPF